MAENIENDWIKFQLYEKRYNCMQMSYIGELRANKEIWNIL